ncbi:MAG: type II 3-dehydroquinate dehydratase [Prevotella sp.]|nr:type II 3-dehydroquinate dehydratase [Prevotella sp.]
MKILILNGPNLNLLGQREPHIYGHETMDHCLQRLRNRYPDVELLYYQSNHEGDLIDQLQQTQADGVVLNAGAYSHTSVALADCIRAVSTPVVEVHLSNIYAREDYRSRSFLSSACRGVISGFGIDVYRLAIEAVIAIKGLTAN